MQSIRPGRFDHRIAGVMFCPVARYKVVFDMPLRLAAGERAMAIAGRLHDTLRSVRVRGVTGPEVANGFQDVTSLGGILLAGRDRRIDLDRGRRRAGLAGQGGDGDVGPAQAIEVQQDDLGVLQLRGNRLAL